jgi:hypothetical protein
MGGQYFLYNYEGVFMKHLLVLSLFFIILFAAGCQESNTVEPINSAEGMSLEKRDGLPLEVHTMLQELKAATAKYHDINKALADGYVDINVVVPHMGHHFLNPAYLDAEFDHTKPEILVYELRPNGKYQLVAAEFAVPLNLSSVPPEGFPGSYDGWVENTGAGIWALHAWVWEKNPLGVFNSTNPNVP